MYLNTDRHGEKATSGDTHRRVDAEVTKMLREAYSRVTALLVRSPHYAKLTVIDIRIQYASQVDFLNVRLVTGSFVLRSLHIIHLRVCYAVVLICLGAGIPTGMRL